MLCQYSPTPTKHQQPFGLHVSPPYIAISPVLPCYLISSPSMQAFYLLKGFFLEAKILLQDEDA